MPKLAKLLAVFGAGSSSMEDHGHQPVKASPFSRPAAQQPFAPPSAHTSSQHNQQHARLHVESTLPSHSDSHPSPMGLSLTSIQTSPGLCTQEGLSAASNLWLGSSITDSKASSQPAGANIWLGSSTTDGRVSTEGPSGVYEPLSFAAVPPQLMQARLSIRSNRRACSAVSQEFETALETGVSYTYEMHLTTTATLLDSISDVDSLFEEAGVQAGDDQGGQQHLSHHQPRANAQAGTFDAAAHLDHMEEHSADHASAMLTVSDLFCDQEAPGGDATKLSAWDMLQLQMPPAFAASAGAATPTRVPPPVVPPPAAVHQGPNRHYKRPALHPSRVLVNGADVSMDSLDMSSLTVSTPPSVRCAAGRPQHMEL